MVNTTILYNSRCLEHDPGSSHPESPQRLRIIMSELEKYGLLSNENCRLVRPEKAATTCLELIHDSSYVSLVEKICSQGGGILDLGDTVASKDSFAAALYAVGGVLEGVNLVMEKECQNSFAFVRPPGHHAGTDYPGGFCLFNNVAIACEHLIRNYALKRVLILDIDAHHGNGTQELFYETDKVLYVGFHEDPRLFPGTGFADEVGEGRGEGYTVNFPFPFKSNDESYLYAFKHVAAEIIRQYKPEFILVSAGFDAHHSDPVANLSLSASAYAEIFQEAIRLASKTCSGRLTAVLEGGYNLGFIGKIASAAVAEMANIRFSLVDSCPAVNTRTQRTAKEMIEKVASIQSSYWNL